MYIVHTGVYSVFMSKDRVFAAAKSVLEQEGLAGLSVRKVAQRAGVSPMAMYNHFADKDALLNALMEDGLAAWEKIVRAIRTPDPMAWLQRLMDAYLDFALREPHRFDAAFFLPATKARQYPDDFSAGRSPAVALMIIHIDQAKSQGRLDNTPALDVALALAAMAQGFISMHRAGRFSSDKQLRPLYRNAVHHCLESFTTAEDGK